MPKGRSLHIGLNVVSPEHYDGWPGRLVACEKDALDMREIARGQDFIGGTLLTQAATRTAVSEGILDAARALDRGDIFFLSFSGHGGHVPVHDGDEVSDDAATETWCLYDGQLIEDELQMLWAKFMPEVRVLVISDTCRSGSVTRMLLAGDTSSRSTPTSADGHALRYMPREVARMTYDRNRALYDSITRTIRRVDVRATVRTIAACQDEQTSQDGAFNGRFTAELKRVWDYGRFVGNYSTFHQAIVARMPSAQKPVHSVIGIPNPAYDAQKPFTI